MNHEPNKKERQEFLVKAAMKGLSGIYSMLEMLDEKTLEALHFELLKVRTTEGGRLAILVNFLWADAKARG